MKPINTTLLKIENEFDINELAQIIELTAHKLNLKTISNYSKDNNISYNGAKNYRSKIDINGVKFIVDGLDRNNLPF